MINEKIMNANLFTLTLSDFFMLSSLLLCSCGVTGSSRPVAQNETIHSDGSNSLQADDYSIRWFREATPDEIKGVALVIHGLNLRPDKMESIISLLTNSGIDVLNLSLRGHGDNYFHDTNRDSGEARLEAFKTVSYQLWIDETYQAYLHARKRSAKEKVPLFLLGYSLGGLLGADLFTSYSDVYFDKMIFLAPAFDLHAINYVIKLLSPFPRLVIPSFSTRSYLSNYGTPMAAYNSLFDTVKHFQKNISLKLNVPTIIFIDKQDELISLHGLKDMVESRNLDQWRFYFLQKEAIGVEGNMNHLIIDEASVGKDTWQEIRNVMINHLL